VRVPPNLSCAVGYRNLPCEYIVVDKAGDIPLPRSPRLTDFHLIQSMVTVPPYAVRSCFAARGNCKVCIEYRWGVTTYPFRLNDLHLCACSLAAAILRCGDVLVNESSTFVAAVWFEAVLMCIPK
jgi:hypothetical protein